MSPLAIEIALHYYAHGDDYRDGDFSAPAVRQTIDWFLEEGFIMPSPSTTLRAACYIATDRLNVYVQHLIAQPMPVQKWVMPPNNGEPHA